jgi:predicted secreted protein
MKLHDKRLYKVKSMSVSQLSLKKADFRSGNEKEAVILGHCVLNMNTRAPGIAAWNGAIFPLFRALRSYSGEVHQYPCPEAAVVGGRRWWHVKEQYDTFTFREILKKLAEIYTNYFMKSDIKEVKLLGLGLSPTCGFRYTQSDPTWGGRPKEIDPSKIIKKDSGVLIEEFVKVFEENGLNFSVLDISPSLIYPDYERRMKVAKEYPPTPSEALKELEKFLGIKIPFKPEEVAHIENLKDDLRSKKMVAISSNKFVPYYDKLLEYAVKGVGIVLVDEVYNNEKEKEFLSDIYASMIGNMTIAGHNVEFLIDSDDLEGVLGKTIERLEALMREGNLSVIKLSSIKR